MGSGMLAVRLARSGYHGETLAAPELFVPFQHPPGRVPPLYEVRSTLVVSSIQSLRARGLFDRYVAELAPTDSEVLLSLIAGTWIPLATADAHYRALDRLGLPTDVTEAIGGDVAQRINKTLLSTIIRASRSAGVTPWTLLSHVHRFRERSWHGSDIAVYKLGPKDARFEWVSQPLAEIPYFVTSLGGYLAALVGLFSTKAYSRVERDVVWRSHRIRVRLSWA
jgi:hypothetical protein